MNKQLLRVFFIGGLLFASGGVMLGVGEIVALLNNSRGDTISEHIWYDLPTWAVATISAVCVGLSILFGWLSSHVWRKVENAQITVTVEPTDSTDNGDSGHESTRVS